MGMHLRFFGTHLLVAITAVGLLAGGAWMWSGLLAGVVLWIGADALSPRAGNAPRYRHRVVLDAALYSLFPALLSLGVVFLWSTSGGDVLRLGALLEHYSGYGALAARADNDALDYLGAGLSSGLAIALAGILTAHELFHRTNDRLAMFVSRWMLAMAFNSTLEVAHVYGHHQDVGTDADPSTARRGENVYAFFLRSTFGQVVQAWRIERERLARRGQSPCVFGNKVLRGYLRSYAVLALIGWVSGMIGVVTFFVCVVWNKLLLESLNYLEHYGLVRVAGESFEPRHAWDSDSLVSHTVLFHLPFHAEHHFDPHTHYYDLHADGRAPVLPHGYLASVLVTLVPFWWRHVIAPALHNWDAERATRQERELLKKQR